jgi:quercetin dioxygenase-like cupin family protein
MEPSLRLHVGRKNYTVKKIDEVVSSQGIRARVFTLAPDETIPWHHHSKVNDHYFVLRGTLTVDTRQADGQSILCTGDRFQIAPGVAHHLSNRGQADCEFLLIQGTGAYDWIGDNK